MLRRHGRSSGPIVKREATRRCCYSGLKPVSLTAAPQRSNWARCSHASSAALLPTGRNPRARIRSRMAGSLHGGHDLPLEPRHQLSRHARRRIERKTIERFHVEASLQRGRDIGQEHRARRTCGRQDPQAARLVLLDHLAGDRDEDRNPPGRDRGRGVGAAMGRGKLRARSLARAVDTRSVRLARDRRRPCGCGCAT